MGELRIVAIVFGGPDSPRNARRMFRLHLAYALLDAAAGGILLNAPRVAIKALQAANWQPGVDPGDVAVQQSVETSRPGLRHAAFAHFLDQTRARVPGTAYGTHVIA